MVFTGSFRASKIVMMECGGGRVSNWWIGEKLRVSAVGRRRGVILLTPEFVRMLRLFPARQLCLPRVSSLINGYHSFLVGCTRIIGHTPLA